MYLGNNVSMLPGTNELVYGNPGGAGQALFNKYGYSINRPRWRDYHNAMQVHGSSFFDDLGAILGGLAGTLGGRSQSNGYGTQSTGSIWGNQGSVTRAVPNNFTLSASNIGLGNVDNALSTQFKTGLATSNYTGQPGWKWGNPSQRAQAFFQLKNHFWNMAQREQQLEAQGLDPFLYPPDGYYPFGRPVAAYVPIGLGGTMAGTEKIDLSGKDSSDDTSGSYAGTGTSFFSTYKNAIMLGVLALVVVIYLKFR